jgi:hypothetical protein
VHDGHDALHHKQRRAFPHLGGLGGKDLLAMCTWAPGKY